MLSIPQLLTTPEWFPDAIYADRGLLDCYRVSRDLLSGSPFLDKRMTTRAMGTAQAAFTYDDLAAAAEGFGIDGIGFIFHTSFCRSTLMAQALHIDGACFPLREPSILLSLAESLRYTRALRDPDRARTALKAMLKLSTGLVADSEKTVFKPTNFANNLLPYVVEAGARVLLMYSDLRSYLISILKYGERGRAFTRQLFTRLMVDCDEFGRMEPRQALLLTDLQIAALVWQQQASLFMKTIDDAPPGQIRTLSSDAFGSNRETAVTEAFKFFAVPASGEQIDHILAGPVFQQHSKSGKSVDDREIHNQGQAVAAKYQDDIEATLLWAQSTGFAGRISIPMPAPLIASEAADRPAHYSA